MCFCNNTPPPVNCPTRWSLFFIFVFLCWSTNEYQKYKSVELGDQLPTHPHPNARKPSLGFSHYSLILATSPMIVSLFSFIFCSKPSILLPWKSRCFLWNRIRFQSVQLPPVHILKVCQSCLRFLVNWLNVIVNLINVFSSVLCHPYNTIMTIIMTIMITLTRSLLITSSCSQIVFTMRGSTGLAVTLSMLIGRSIIMMSSASAFEW